MLMPYHPVKTAPNFFARAFTVIFLAAVICQGQIVPIHKADSLAVRAIIVGAGVPHFQVREITDINQEGRVVSLIFQSPILKTLAPEIGELDALVNLHLGETRLSELPRQIADLKSLKVLSLRAGSLHQLPQGMENLKMLETLDLFDNNLTQLPLAVLELKNLKQLRLGKNCLELSPSQAQWADRLDKKWRSSQSADYCESPVISVTNLDR
jgi:hypothetical protein